MSLELRKRREAAHGVVKATLPFPNSSQCLLVFPAVRWVKPGCCWKRKTLERKIIRDVNKSLCRAGGELASSGADVSRTTAVRDLHRGRHRSHCPRESPLPQQWHIKAGLQFAHEQWTHGSEIIKSVLWSDETRLDLMCCLRHWQPCSCGHE